MLDVDGTLVENRQDALPSRRVTEAVEKAKNSIHICIVTGRPLYHMHKIFDHLQLSGIAILNGGTRIIELVSKKVLWERPMNYQDYVEALGIAKQLGKEIFVSDGDKDYNRPHVKLHKKIFGIYVPALTLDEANTLEKKLSHMPTIFIHKMISWEEGKIDIFVTHAQATKQHGILEVAKILGINTHEIIGVGDAYNDFPLLMACGLKVAMGNAVEELKAIADYIAPTVEEDGVADVIEKFVL